MSSGIKSFPINSELFLKYILYSNFINKIHSKGYGDVLYQLTNGQCSNSPVRYLLKLVDVRSIEPSRHSTETYNRKVHYDTGKAYLKHIFFLIPTKLT